MEKEYPKQGEIVLGKIKRVNPFSTLVSLEEYPGLEGMIHISEISSKWVKDIRKHVKVGQNVVVKVMWVDKKKGHISLSLKRVRPREKEEKLKTVRNEQRACKMLKTAANKINADEVEIKKITKMLKDGFGDIFTAFKKASESSGKELLIKRGIDKKWAEVISEIAEKSIVVKEKVVKIPIDMKCYEGEGINVIKKAIKSLDKDVSIKYISAPRYVLEMKTKDAKKADRKLRKCVEKMNAILKRHKGEVSIVK